MTDPFKRSARTTESGSAESFRAPDDSGGRADPVRAVEQQLRREVEDLRRQLREREAVHAGPPAEKDRWKPSPVTISALLILLAVLLVGAFFAGYIPLQRRDTLVRAETQERQQELPHMETIRVARSSIRSELVILGT